MADKKVIHIEVDKELHQQLKLVAVQEGMTLKDAVILAIQNLVEKKG